MPHHDSKSCFSQRLNQRTSCVATEDIFDTIGQEQTNHKRERGRFMALFEACQSKSLDVSLPLVGADVRQLLFDPFQREMGQEPLLYPPSTFTASCNSPPRRNRISLGQRPKRPLAGV